MKLVYASALAALLMVSAQASQAKARPMPKPTHKCPAGQKWDGSMKMCMKK